MTFDEFWSVYPRKVGKAMARSKFAAVTGRGLEVNAIDRDGNKVALTHQEAPEALIRAAKAYAADMWAKDTDERYIAHPSTWLNQGRWEDYEGRDDLVASFDRTQETKKRLRLVG